VVYRVGYAIWLKDGAVETFAAGRAEIPRKLAGAARRLNELVDGVSMVDGEPSVLPPNPQGLIGWDMSGPPWGSAWRHPVAWFGGRGTDSTGWQAPPEHTPLIHTAGDEPAAIGGELQNRPHEVLPQGYVAPYSSLELLIRARVRSATATLTVRGRVDDGPLVSLGTCALTTTMTSYALATHLTMPGGGQNIHAVHIEVETSAGVAEVECGSLNVWAKRNAA